MKRITITAQEPPEDVKTLAQWLEWREAENQRMFAALDTALHEMAEGFTAQFERDANGHSQH